MSAGRFKSHNHIIMGILMERIAKVKIKPCVQKRAHRHNCRCEVDRKELRGLVSQIVSVSVIVSGASLEFKRGVIGGGGRATPSYPPDHGMHFPVC